MPPLRGVVRLGAHLGAPWRGRLVRRIVRLCLRHFPGCRIILCADAAFPLPPLYRFLEAHGVGYAVGMPRNKGIHPRAQHLERKVERRWCRSRLPQRGFSSFRYRAWRWRRHRRFCFKVERNGKGLALRFLATHMPGRAEEVFRFYPGRGECENRISEIRRGEEELKNGFAADRLSCHRYLANAFRLLLHRLAYNLVNLLRLQLPAALRSAQIETLRIQVFKLGGRVRRTARRVWVHLAGGWPFQDLFCQVCLSLDTN